MKLLTFNNYKDYKKLNHLPFNRDFSVRQDLMGKMNKYGFTIPINIIKTDIIDGLDKYWIADGQHRAVTALHLDIPFYGIVVDLKFSSVDEIVRYVASLNSASKSWTLKNYVESYNYLNYAGYNTLLRLSNTSPYSVNTLSCMLHGVRSTNSVNDKVKSGEFKVNYLKETEETLKHAAALSKYEQMTSRMILALSYLRSQKSFKKSEFDKNYILNSKTIKSLKLDDYTDIFTQWIK